MSNAANGSYEAPTLTDQGPVTDLTLGELGSV